MLVGGRKIEREEFNQELAALDRRRDRSFDRSGSAAGVVGNNQTFELFSSEKTELLKRNQMDRDPTQSDQTVAEVLTEGNHIESLRGSLWQAEQILTPPLDWGDVLLLLYSTDMAKPIGWWDCV